MRLIAALALAGSLFFAGSASAQATVTLEWDPNPEPDVVGYTLYSGTAPGAYTVSQNVGNVTRRAMTLPAGQYYFAVRAYNAAGLTSDLSEEVSTTIPVTGDQPAGGPTWQAIWHNSDSGQILSWDMRGTSMVGAEALGAGTLDPAWQVRGHADMNGDGHKDVLLQHLEKGYLAAWLMNGTQLVETRMLNQLTDPKWLLVGAADFNGDTKMDLVFQHTTRGTLGAWLMNGLLVAEGLPLTPGGVTDAAWRVVAVADMNGDRKADLVWQHQTSGRITTWLMNGTTMQSAGPFSTTGPTDTAWKVRGVADVDDNGAQDLLWQHTETGHIAVWTLNGFTVTDAKLLNPGRVTSAWSLAGSR